MVKPIVFYLAFAALNINATVLDGPSDVISWSENYQLKFSDFKGKAKIDKNNKLPRGEFAINISWIATIGDGEPKYQLYNKFNPQKSWMNINHTELIKEYQFIWNLQEFYVRKARKQIDDLNKKHELKEEVYLDAINKTINQFHKARKHYDGILQNQPDLYRILNTKYQDSLKLYNKYKL